MISYSGCAQLAPHIIHLLQACDRIGAEIKWLGNHSSYHILKQLRVKLHWFHLRYHYPPPVLHMTASVSFILIPYIDDVLIIVVGMIGGMTYGLYVPIGSEILHISYASCFREKIGQHMIATLGLLFPYGMSHLVNLNIWEEHFMDGLIEGHLVHEESLSHGGVTREGGEELQHSPLQLLEDNQHLGGEGCNIPNYLLASWNIKFCFCFLVRRIRG